MARNQKLWSGRTILSIILPKLSMIKKNNDVCIKKINTIISSWILEDPSRWLWIHRRWTKDIYKT